VFCRYTQIEAEVNKVWDIVDAFYKGVGFKDLKVRLSLHDPDEFDKYIGSREVWQQAEDRLLKAAQARGVEYYEQQGEAAMYGPKIDFMAYDALGREWQVATIQLDMNMPERFALTCVSEKGEKERIVMLHVAIMGSIERFMSILIEHYAGAFPTWLSPVQVNIIPISEKNQAYAQKLTNSLKEQGVRVELSDPNESMQKRIRQAEKQKIPYMLVVGEKEASENAVAVRMRGKRDLGIMKIEDFITKIHQEIVDKLTE
jgi:threonyl-tRNA synthetase